MFDGHAGPDAALMTSKLLHKHIVDKLKSRIQVLKAKLCPEGSENTDNGSGIELEKQALLNTISADSIIVGAVEESFIAMVGLFPLRPANNWVYCNLVETSL